MSKRNVILVTDGDQVARSAVELATSKIGGRCISESAGNPTPHTGEELIKMIKTAQHDPVVVMVDDRGRKGIGKGEQAMGAIIKDDGINILGIVAVSSNGRDCNGVNVTCSITNEGQVIEGGVDKYGNDIGEQVICGDTLSILAGKPNITIVGIGDPGKMDYKDEILKGAPITTMALEEIMKRSGYKHKRQVFLL